jgi:hypothetical protein
MEVLHHLVPPLPNRCHDDDDDVSPNEKSRMFRPLDDKTHSGTHCHCTPNTSTTPCVFSPVQKLNDYLFLSLLLKLDGNEKLGGWGRTQ